jgi:hypothetical protein
MKKIRPIPKRRRLVVYRAVLRYYEGLDKTWQAPLKDGYCGICSQLLDHYIGEWYWQKNFGYQPFTTERLGTLFPEFYSSHRYYTMGGTEDVYWFVRDREGVRSRIRLLKRWIKKCIT